MSTQPHVEIKDFDYRISPPFDHYEHPRGPQSSRRSYRNWWRFVVAVEGYAPFNVWLLNFVHRSDGWGGLEHDHDGMFSDSGERLNDETETIPHPDYWADEVLACAQSLHPRGV